MEISTRLIDNTIEILIDGVLNNYNEYIEMKNIIQSAINNDIKVIFYFVNSISISSYILGYILKLKEVDKKHIDIIVGNSKLHHFLQSIEFDNFFKIKIKEYE